MRSLRIGLLTALVAAFGFAGCGGGSSPEDVVSSYMDDLEGESYAEACDRLTESGQLSAHAFALEDAVSSNETIEEDTGCEDGLELVGEELRDEDVKAWRDVSDVDESSDGDTATVAIDGGEWQLEEVDGEWRIDGPLPSTD